MKRSNQSLIDDYLRLHAGHGPIDRSYCIAKRDGVPMLIGGCYPRSKGEDIDLQKYKGIKLFVNLCEEPLSGYKDLARRKNNCDAIEFPVVDTMPPKDEELLPYIQLVDTVRWYVCNKLPVYVHCRGGIGRTGTFAVVYLLRHAAMSASVAIDLLARLREYDLVRGSWVAPDIDQERWILKNESKLKNNTSFQKTIDKALRRR